MKNSVLLSALAALSVAAPTAETLKVPLTRRTSVTNSDGSVNAAKLISEFRRTLTKYNRADLASQLDSFNVNSLERRASNVPLTDQVEDGNQDELYYGNVLVGSAKQLFTTDFDTGSADFFVPGPQCGAAQGCPGTTKYNQQGTDEHNTTSVTYGSGMVTGENYFDTVTVGGLTTTHTNVISLTQAAGFNTSDSDALMGMGFSTIANSKQPTFFENLISQKKITDPRFAFYLGRAASGTQGASEMTLGGVDSSKYTGALTSVPVTKKGYWQVALGGVNVNGANAFFSQGAAAIDTGTTIILAPSVSAASIYSNIPGSAIVANQGGLTLYSYPCNANPKVAIKFAGKNFAINPLDFNLGQVSDSASTVFGLPNPFASSGPSCIGAIAGADIDPVDNLYVVGDSFLKNWYSVYSYAGSASVSFAAAKGNQ